jgi:hypothetical protein
VNFAVPDDPEPGRDAARANGNLRSCTAVGSVHVIVDVLGTDLTPGGAWFHSLVPNRILDSLGLGLPMAPAPWTAGSEAVTIAGAGAIRLTPRGHDERDRHRHGQFVRDRVPGGPGEADVVELNQVRPSRTS